MISTAINRLQYITQEADGLDLSAHHQLPYTLLDLANYKQKELSRNSLHLLNRYFTSQSDVFVRAHQTQLLKTPQSCELYNTVEGLFLELLAFLRSDFESDNWKDPSPVKLLTRCCWLEEEVEGFEPHQINQNIILSFGIITNIVVLTIIKSKM